MSSEPCGGCGCEDTFVEWLDEQQTGKAFFVTRVLHCCNCGSRFDELRPS